MVLENCEVDRGQIKLNAHVYTSPFWTGYFFAMVNKLNVEITMIKSGFGNSPNILMPKPKTRNPVFPVTRPCLFCTPDPRERSGRVLDSRRRGRGFRDSPASLRCGPWVGHFYPSLVLVQPRKTHPVKLKDCWWDVKNQIKQYPWP